MVEVGDERIGVQSKDKLKKVKSEYKIKSINEVPDNKPATQPEAVIDTLVDAEQSGEGVVYKD